jgi:hypothetical protein
MNFSALRGVDRDNLLVFGCWVEEIASHKGNSKEPNLSRSLESRQEKRTQREEPPRRLPPGDWRRTRIDYQDTHLPIF